MIIRTFQDVERELTTLRRELDRIGSLNLDLNGRRIINAGKSVAGSDYVTRDELYGLKFPVPEKQKIAPGWLQVDFTVNTPTVGDDIAPRPVPWIPLTQKGIPVLCGARLRTAPDGGDFSIRWNHYSKYDDNTVDLFNGNLLTIADGQEYATITAFYPNRAISTQDYFTIDVTEVNDGAGLYTFLAVMVP